MDRLTQFRLTADSFNDTEFELFCNKLFEHYGKKTIIIKSLFFLALHEFKRNKFDCINKLNAINHEVTDLRTYEEAEERTLDLTHNPFNSTPSAITSHIATYLQTSELLSFIMSARYIHKSCTAIPTIQKFKKFPKYLTNYGDPFTNFQMQKLSRFNILSQASFDYSSINEETFGINAIKWVWNKLNCLKIRNFRSLPIRRWIRKYSIQKQDAHCQYLTHIIKHMQLKQLKMINVNLRYSQVDNFFSLLSANKNLEYLSIDKLYLNQGNLSEDILVDLGRIKALALNTWDHDISDKLLCPISNQLQSLHIHLNYTYTFPDSSQDDKRYEDIQELCVSTNGYIDLSNSPVSNIFKTAANLRRIYWNAVMDKEYVFCMIQDLTNVQCITFVNLRDWTHIMDALKSGSMRENMKIKLKYGGITPEFLKYIEANLSEFADILSQSVTKDFLLECSFDVNELIAYDWNGERWLTISSEDYIGVNKVLHSLKEKYSVDFSMQTKMNQELIERICISNKHSSMDGYCERWLYSCKKCKERLQVIDY